MIHTVCGSIEDAALGTSLHHEHFAFGFTGYRGDASLAPYDEASVERVAAEIAKRVKAAGIDTVIDVTPADCERNVALLKRVSAASGLNILCSCGYYNEILGGSVYYKNLADRLSKKLRDVFLDAFLRELQGGIGDTGIKPAIIKVASQNGRISDYEKSLFEASVLAQRETGAPILTHTHAGTMGVEQAELFKSLRAIPEKTLIGHMCGNLRLEDHARILNMGFREGFDRFGHSGSETKDMRDEYRLNVLLPLIRAGYADRLLLSQDAIGTFLGRDLLDEQRRADACVTKMLHVHDEVLPTLRAEGVNDWQIARMTSQNLKEMFQ